MVAHAWLLKFLGVANCPGESSTHRISSIIVDNFQNSIFFSIFFFLPFTGLHSCQDSRDRSPGQDSNTVKTSALHSSWLMAEVMFIETCPRGEKRGISKVNFDPIPFWHCSVCFWMLIESSSQLTLFWLQGQFLLRHRLEVWSSIRKVSNVSVGRYSSVAGKHKKLKWILSCFCSEESKKSLGMPNIWKPEKTFALGTD